MSMLIYVLALGELITFGWLYGVKRICQDVEFMLGQKIHWYWRLSWGFIAPIIMIIVFIYNMITLQPLIYNYKEFSTGLLGKQLNTKQIT